MNNKFAMMCKATEKFLIKRSPEILTGLGLAGLVSSGIMAVRATPKALQILDDKVFDRDGCHSPVDEVSKMLPKKEVVKLTWKCYMPSIITGFVSVSCIIGASAVNYKRNAALATAYNITATTLATYKDKVIDILGPEDAEKVDNAVAKETIEKNPVRNHEVIITGDDEQLFYDTISGRYFKSSVHKIKDAEIAINERLTKSNEMYASLNDFYYELGLKNTMQGTEIGWNIYRGVADISFSTQLTEDGRSCIVLNYLVPPLYDYMKI